MGTPVGVVRTKPGVLFTMIAPGGFRILSAIDQTAAECNWDLIITSAGDGAHSGPNDPHHRGEAYDIRSHEFNAEEKQTILASLRKKLGERFYVFLEDEGLPNEHFHAQVCKGTTFP